MTINLSDLNSLVAAGESQTLELKKSTAEKDRACRTLCALANGAGGWETLPALGCEVDSLDRREIVVTPEMLQPHEFKPWNPWIAKVFHRRGLIETWGRGTLKMAGLMQEAGLQPPTMAVQGDCVVLTFRLAQSLGAGSEKTPDVSAPPKVAIGRCYQMSSCLRIFHGGCRPFRP